MPPCTPPRRAWRYNILEPVDIALFEFGGAVVPETITMVLAAKQTRTDAALHASLNGFLGDRKMATIAPADLQRIIHDAKLSKDHPAAKMTQDPDLEDAALGGSQGAERLWSRSARRPLTSEEMQRAKRNAEEIGRLGEELTFAYLSNLRAQGTVKSFEWVSNTNAVEPYDFSVTEAKAYTAFVDVKSTAGEFSNPIHISLAEVKQIALGEEEYRIYRVYAATPKGGKMRICRNLKPFAKEVLKTLAALPEGVTADGISVAPAKLQFEPELSITAAEADEEQA
jgi:hypothetical protein